MRLEHVAVWTPDIERMRSFYERYFAGRAGPPYRSATRPGFRSYFVTFPDGGSRLELMTAPDVRPGNAIPAGGYAHVAITVGSRADVDSLTARMRGDGVRILSGPRQTGDGYYEAVVEDPDGNAVEITADDVRA